MIYSLILTVFLQAPFKLELGDPFNFQFRGCLKLFERHTVSQWPRMRCILAINRLTVRERVDEFRQKVYEFTFSINWFIRLTPFLKERTKKHIITKCRRSKSWLSNLILKMLKKNRICWIPKIRGVLENTTGILSMIEWRIKTETSLQSRESLFSLEESSAS